MNNRNNKYINMTIASKLSMTGISLLHAAAYPSLRITGEVRLSSHEVYLLFWMLMKPNHNKLNETDNILSVYLLIVVRRELDRLDQVINKVNKVE